MKASTGVRFVHFLIFLSGTIGRLNAASSEPLHYFSAFGTLPVRNLIEVSVGTLYVTIYACAFTDKARFLGRHCGGAITGVPTPKGEVSV